ncbi:MAG: hypothetical protein ACYC2U_05455 [Candidatus Amoebophilus sp.]
MAQNNLGWMYHNGCGMPKNDEEAINGTKKQQTKDLCMQKKQFIN